ncbi:protein Diedel-like [Drosophila nasuta]|uniref:protein Diedel-like n=1 Tax=Drosophila nasuta TaxID=42062 RepID=UPI00295F022A|nr:protein Diedel-like [Drosophila nasuta]
MKLIAIVLLIACSLAYISIAEADCCRASLTLSYNVIGGYCADAGGHSGTKGCTITVCADGRPQVGTFCGRGSCNIFGCACKGGCITGKYLQSFYDVNRGRNIRVTDMSWNL